MRLTKFLLLGALSLFVFIAGCGTKADIGIVDAAVTKFHNQLDAGKFDEMYDESDDAFKAAATKQKFVDLLSAIHRKLGSVKSAGRQGFFVNFGTVGERIRLTYSSQFENDHADEEFVFQVSGKSVRLVGYHINSDALITR
jgi:hypothetical protein